jgi:hypothetical protein
MKRTHLIKKRKRLAEGEQQPPVKSGALRLKAEANSTDQTNALLEHGAEHMQRPNAGISL